MPTPTETFYNMRKLNRIFALIALAGLGSIIWLVARNYTQDWREYQREAVSWEQFIVSQDIELRGDAARAKIEEIEEKIAEIEANLEDGEKYEDYWAAKEEIEAGQEQLDKLAFQMQGVKAQIDQDKLLLEQVRLTNPAARPDLERSIESNQATYDGLLRKQDGVLLAMKEANELIADTEKNVGLTDARKRLSDARRDWDALLAEAEALKPGWQKSLRDAPLIDFLAPTQEVHEVYLNNVKQDMVFTTVPAVDRCATCHVNIGNPTFTRRALVDRLIYFLLESEQDPMSADDPNAMRLTDPKVQKIFRDTSPPRLAELWDALIADARYAGYLKAREDMVGTFEQGVVGTVDKAISAAGIDPETGDPAKAGSKSGSIASPKVIAKIDETVSGPAADAWNGLVADSLLYGFRQAVQDMLRRLGQQNVPERDQFARLLHEAGVIYFELAPPDDLPPGVDPARAQFSRLIEQAQAERQAGGLAPLEWSNALLAHPKLDLFVSPDSPHSLTAVGCAVCHEGAGQETDFFYAAHTPSSKLQRDVWESSDWKDFESKLAGLDKETREQQIRAAKYSGWQPHHWHVQHYWDRPMLPLDNVEASCAKCHTQIYDIQSAAPRLSKGRELFSQVGCINCHQVAGLEQDNRRVGPDLAHIQDKLQPEWMTNWVRAPRDFRPSTRMPHFFRRPNNNDTDNVWRTEVEIQGMTDYLMARSSPSGMEKPPEGLKGDALAGRELFKQVGCLGCHNNLAENGDVWVRQVMVQKGVPEEQARAKVAEMDYHDRVAWLLANEPERMSRVAPELSRVGAKTTSTWLYGWLRNPSHYSSTTKMPSLRLTQAEALNLATWLGELKLDMDAYSRRVNARLEAAYGEPIANPQPEPSVDMKRMDRAVFTARMKELTARFDEVRRQGGRLASTEIKWLLLDEPRRTTAELLTSKLSRSEAVDRVWVWDELEDWNELAELGLKKMTRAEVMKWIAENAPEPAEDELTPAQRSDLLRRTLVDELTPYWGGGTPSGSLDELASLYIGSKAINLYGCFGCHNVPGFEKATKIGTELSDWGDKNLHKLDFAYFAPVYRGRVPDMILRPESPGADQPEWARLRDVEEPELIHETKLDWLFWKLRSPRIYDRRKTVKRPYELLKMPHFAFSEEEIKSLQTFVVSRRNPLVDPVLQDTTPGLEKAIPRGRQLVRTWNCIGCHRVDSNTPHIAQTFRFFGDRVLPDSAWHNLLGTNAPPLLIGEGAKVQPDWLFHFFGNVETLRPGLNVRMPTFPLSDQEKRDLVEFFVATVDKDRRELEALILDGEGKPRFDRFSENDWAKLRKLFATVDNQLPAPDKLETTAIRSTFDKLSDREYWAMAALHYRALYKVEYPFETTGQSTEAMSPARKAEIAETIRQACITCHQFQGIPSGGGVRAPALHLSHRRLRQPWFAGWTADAMVAWPGSGPYPAVVMPVPPFVEPRLRTMAHPASLVDAMDGESARTLADVVRYVYQYGEQAERERQENPPPATESAPTTQPAMPVAATP